jgi:hypothetical protein
MNNGRTEATKVRFDVDPLDFNRLKRQERAAKLIEEKKLRESKKQVHQFEMQLAGPNDDISEILSRNLFQQHKPLVYNHSSDLKPDFDEDMLCKSPFFCQFYSAFDEPAFFGIEDRSYRLPERNRKL